MTKISRSGYPRDLKMIQMIAIDIISFIFGESMLMEAQFKPMYAEGNYKHSF